MKGHCDSMLSSLGVVLVTIVVAPGVGCAGSRSWEPAALTRVLRAEAGKLGPGYELASYGRRNPDCWGRDTAPPKARRRLEKLICQGISPQVRFCQAEFVRRGTHEDILVKVFVLQSASEARRALATPFVKGRRRRLARHGLPRPERVGNVVLYVVGSRANFGIIPSVFKRIRARLSR